MMVIKGPGTSDGEPEVGVLTVGGGGGGGGGGVVVGDKS